MTLPDTLLPLTRFAQLIGYSPVLFNQVFIPGEQEPSACSDPVLEYMWQTRGGGQPGRADIAEAVQRAEQTLAEHLGFTVVPTHRVDTVKPARTMPGSVSRGVYTPWMHTYDVPLFVRNSHVQQLGAYAETYVTSAPVSWTDADGDGYSETGSVQVVTTVPASELRVFYPGFDPAYGERREIRPITATQGDGNVVLRFPRYLAVTFNLLESYNAGGVNGLDNANFLDTVDIIRVYTDTSQQAIVSWLPSWCTDPTQDQTRPETQTAYGIVLNAELGAISVRPGTYSALTGTWTPLLPAGWQTPLSVQVSYLAGHPLVNGRMAPQLERAVVFLALNYLSCPWTTCEPLHALMEHWRTDLAERRSNPGESVGYVVSPGMLNNPLGTTRAAVNAWRVVQQLATGQAVSY